MMLGLSGIEDTPGFTGDTSGDYGLQVSNWSGSSTDYSSLISALSNAATAATLIYKNTQSPSVIPGTNLVYNPASNAILNSAGVTVGSLGQAASATLGSVNINTIALMGVGLVGVLVLVMVLKK